MDSGSIARVTRALNSVRSVGEAFAAGTAALRSVADAMKALGRNSEAGIIRDLVRDAAAITLGQQPLLDYQNDPTAAVPASIWQGHRQAIQRGYIDVFNAFASAGLPDYGYAQALLDQLGRAAKVVADAPRALAEALPDLPDPSSLGIGLLVALGLLAVIVVMK